MTCPEWKQTTRDWKVVGRKYRQDACEARRYEGVDGESQLRLMWPGDLISVFLVTQLHLSFDT